MAAAKNSFEHWRTLARSEPERLADLFLGKLELLPPEGRRAFIATVPARDSLLQNIKAACADEDALLSGVPYMLQDLFDVEGLPTRCGAPFPGLFDAPLEDDSLLHHTLKSLGAALLGKTVSGEFGISLRGHNKNFGDCPHADGLRYIPGGGAGTCAHAVKTGWAPLAFGLDSSAGIRIPAAFNGLFGFRMGHNDYARKGVFPIVPSLESIGWVCARPEDLQATIQAFHPLPMATEPASPQGFRLDDPTIALDPCLKAGLMDLVRQLDTGDSPETNKALCQVFKEANEAFTIIESRELYAVHQYWIEEYRALYDEGLLRRIEAGQICTAEKAERAATIQQQIREAMVSFFLQYDYLIVPICPVPNPERAGWSGQLENDLLRLNAPTSLSFLPALILPFPCGESRHSAVQLILNPKKIHLSTAILEQVSDFYA